MANIDKYSHLLQELFNSRFGIMSMASSSFAFQRLPALVNRGLRQPDDGMMPPSLSKISARPSACNDTGARELRARP